MLQPQRKQSWFQVRGICVNRSFTCSCGEFAFQLCTPPPTVTFINRLPVRNFHLPVDLLRLARLFFLSDKESQTKELWLGLGDLYYKCMLSGVWQPPRGCHTCVLHLLSLHVLSARSQWRVRSRALHHLSVHTFPQSSSHTHTSIKRCTETCISQKNWFEKPDLTFNKTLVLPICTSSF